MSNAKEPPDHDAVAPENELNGITLVPEQSRQYCNQRQLVDYRQHRETFIKWLLTLGKDPDHGEGYAHATARRRACDCDVFYRWLWTDRNGSYTLAVDHADADAYCQELALGDHSDSHRANIQKSLKTLFRWRDDTDEWEPQLSFGGNSSARRPKDYLSPEERQRIREAALEYGTVPSPYTLDGEQKERWKNYLAMRLRKPAEKITTRDFERVNGFKIPSLVCTGLDAGLRPAEIGRAKVSWIDVDNAVLRIPAEDAAKHRDNWTVPIREQTARYLDRWLDERALYDRYADTDHLWLTREDNPYSSRSLKHLLRRLCDEAGIDYRHRQMTWYTVRHSVGQIMTAEAGLEAAAEQLRHSSTATTRKYTHPSVEERRDALERR
jgi:site-specific recombinase XerD